VTTVEPPAVRKIWWMFVRASLRSKFGASVLVLMVAATVYLFVRGNVVSALILLGFMLVSHGRVFAVLGAYIGVRRARRSSRS
jgi:hypothetical protein